MKWMHRDRLQAVIAKGIASGVIRELMYTHKGYKASKTVLSWDISGKCKVPQHRVLAARADRGSPDPKSLYLNLKVKCRKCDECRKARRNEWRDRMRNELRSSHRTWFGSMTLSPEAHFLMVTRARAKAGHDANDWSTRDEFRARDSQAYKEVQKFFKRVRKETGLPAKSLRYVCITEAHKSGLPHYHVLVHEKFHGQNVRHKCLNHHWHLGFCNFKLVKDERQALYLAKYLSKDATARVRPSGYYGQVAKVAEAKPVSRLASF